MEIRCPSCQTRYELDLELVQRGAVRVQCTRCTSIFRVESRSTQADSWKIRRRDGRIIEFDGLHTLQRWIVERRVERVDEISRTGEQWKTLGAITELSSFFAVIDELDRVSSDDHALPDAFDGLDALDAIQSSDAPRGDGDGDDLTQALLASLSVERSQVRRPISSAVAPPDADALRALRASIDDAPDVDIELELPSVSATMLAHPRPTRAPTLHQLPESSATPPPGELAAPAAAPVDLPEVSATGHGWFTDDAPIVVEEDFGEIVVEDEPEPPAPRAAEVERAVPLMLGDAPEAFAPNRNRATILIAAVVGLAVAALVVALTSGGGEATTTNQAEATPSAPDEPADTPPPREVAPGELAERPAEPPEVPPADADAGTEAAADTTPTADTAPTDPETGPDTLAAAAPVDPAPPSTPPEDPPRTAHAPSDTSDATSDATPNDSDGGGGYASHLKRAERARDKGDLQAALLHYESALVAKRTAEAYAGMGWTYIGLGDAFRATSFFERAIELSASYGDAYIGLGKAYQKLGKKKQALGIYEDYLEQFPSGPQSSIAEAQARRLREELAEATPKKTTPPTPPENDDTAASPPTEPDPPADDKKIIIIKKTP